MVYVCLTAYLCALSIWDVREKELPVKVLAVGMIGSLLYGIWKHWGLELLLGSIPGMLLILMGFLTREKVGYGDGVVVLILGNVLKWPEGVLIYVMAQFGVLFFAVVLLWCRRAPWETKIPFVPFLTVALMIYMVGGALL